jgi:hypothetical protein
MKLMMPDTLIAVNSVENGKLHHQGVFLLCLLKVVPQERYTHCYGLCGNGQAEWPVHIQILFIEGSKQIKILLLL